MIQDIRAALPDPEVLLSLAPQELARVLLTVIRRQRDMVTLQHLVTSRERIESAYGGQYTYAIQLALTEAWNWLVVHGLLVPKPPAIDARHTLSRAGKKIASDADFSDFTKAALLPRSLLHPKIAEDAWANFLRGAHDLAVFAAFKQVEVAVREAAGCDDRTLGVELMRKAFDAKRGPLTDYTLPDAEREALAHLFAGAIGSYKNPSSHRTVTIADATEAGEMLILASHLLRIAEDRARRRRGEGPPLYREGDAAASATS
jgi:uncharacterized protein (TIGR02391 family)